MFYQHLVLVLNLDLIAKILFKFFFNPFWHFFYFGVRRRLKLQQAQHDTVDRGLVDERLDKMAEGRKVCIVQ